VAEAWIFIASGFLKTFDHRLGGLLAPTSSVCAPSAGAG